MSGEKNELAIKIQSRTRIQFLHHLKHFHPLFVWLIRAAPPAKSVWDRKPPPPAHSLLSIQPICFSKTHLLWVHYKTV